MFTDTKNLANLSVNATNGAAKALISHSQQQQQQQDEDKFKLRKMWKPIIRLMSRKSALARNGKRDTNSSCGSSSTSTIPNNVNLNNAAHSSSASKDASTPSEDSSSYIVAHKLPMAEFWHTRQQQEPQQHQHTSQQPTSNQALELISKASIDKAPLDTCTNCVYGRNCQHTQFHETQATLLTNVNSQTQMSHPQMHAQLLPQQGFNYFDAEDGCFVWCDNSADDIDESALREWLWQNSWQFAENATVC